MAVGAGRLRQSRSESFVDNINEMVDLSAELLRDRGWRLSADGLTRSKAVMPRCRLESIDHHYGKLFDRVWLDVGHNAEAIEGVLASIRKTIGEQGRILVVVGSKASKDVRAIFEAIDRHRDIIEQVKVCSLLDQTSGSLLPKIREASAGLGVKVSDDIRHLKDHLAAICLENHTGPRAKLDGLLIVGSFHLMADACAFFGRPLEVDEIEMNNSYRFKAN